MDTVLLRIVHASDGEPCVISDQDHDDLICMHGQRVVEAYAG